MILRRATAVLVNCAFMLGLIGTYQYAQGYTLYRGFGPPVTHQPPSRQGRIVSLVVRSRALARWPATVRVYLPAMYNAEPTRRFPTVYLLQGMPGGSRSAFEGALHLEPLMDDGIAAGRLQPMIVVMPPGNRKRFDLATEWANGPTPGTQWDTYLTRDVVAAVDHAFRTIPTAAARGVGGYSSGADGAVNTVVLHHDLFHVGEGWSADLRQTPGLVGRDPTLVRRYTALANVKTAAPLLRRAHASLYLYVGRNDHARVNDRWFVSVLRAGGVQVRFDQLDGGHNWRLWHNQFPTSLAYFSDHLHP